MPRVAVKGDLVTQEELKTLLATREFSDDLARKVTEYMEK